MELIWNLATDPNLDYRIYKGDIIEKLRGTDFLKSGTGPINVCMKIST